uniref:Secreted protein n=1 Tax=Echinococcus granulosus TaxID=6210 RepID=U6JK42_ECHGR|nr:hypothetical protein EgrG_002044400 [Echinococcus granulosus]CDS23733.1 hypothetical protein EgrG_002044500 [Echinococcus granulosus]
MRVHDVSLFSLLPASLPSSLPSFLSLPLFLPSSLPHSIPPLHQLHLTSVRQHLHFTRLSTSQLTNCCSYASTASNAKWSAFAPPESSFSYLIIPLPHYLLVVATVIC